MIQGYRKVGGKKKKKNPECGHRDISPTLAKELYRQRGVGLGTDTGGM